MADATSSPIEAAEAARRLWLTATCQSHLDEVERLYRWALSTKGGGRSGLSDGDDELAVGCDDDVGPSRKKRKKSSGVGIGCGLNREQFNQVGERFALLLCQSGRCQRARKGLASMGFTCRLAEGVLDYPSDDDCDSRGNDHVAIDEKKSGESLPPCQIVDGFLSKPELERLRLVFQSPEASYWTDHQYEVEPPSPYFSYVIPLEEIRNGTKRFGFIGDLIQKIVSCPILNGRFPRLRGDAKFVEIWAHNRPHASGHQMHFDSDDEGRGGVRHPIISTILYVSAEDVGQTRDKKPAGGPSLVTNQKLTDVRAASRGWMAHPRPRRLVAFDGRCLHGVVPGKGYREGRRVTLMMAFWEDIRIRFGAGPGSARPFPMPTDDDSSWANQLVSPLADTNGSCGDHKSRAETDPIKLDTIYETLDGRPWKRGMGMPSYDEVFQGF